MESHHILVTGAAGFIGSHIVSELRSRGHTVTSCDVFNTEREEYLRCDVREFRQLERVFADREFDYVYHLAAEYGRWNGEDFYEELWETNCVGTKNIVRLQEALKFRLIFFSSAEVYGEYDATMVEEVMDRVPIRQLN